MPVLDKNRFFDPDPLVREIALKLYDEVKELPIVSPHGHVDPKIFAENKPFPNPTELILIPDHYIFRMLYSQGLSLESLGIPSVDGTPVETDHRKVWQIFADKYYLFAGTPTGVWLDHELSEVFGIKENLDGNTALDIYDRINEKLNQPEYLPRALFDSFNIEVLTTTDKATDSLEYHKQIKESGWKSNIIPCFRPDSITDISSGTWTREIQALGDLCGFEISSYSRFIRAIETRREFFKSIGAVSTDHGVLSPYTHQLTEKEAENIFQNALSGSTDEKDSALFTAHMLMEMARMSIDDGLVMQLHPGSFIKHNKEIYQTYGADKGGDIHVQAEFTYNLYELLNKYGNDSRLTLIVFTLDESTYSRELAPLAGFYPALKLGPPWWFHDSIEGMTRFRRMVTETAGIYNTAGFNDDTRAFPSIPARHDMLRRIDSNYLARLTARHIIDFDDAVRMIHDLAYNLVKKAYKLE